MRKKYFLWPFRLGQESVPSRSKSRADLEPSWSWGGANFADRSLTEPSWTELNPTLMVNGPTPGPTWWRGGARNLQCAALELIINNPIGHDRPGTNGFERSTTWLAGDRMGLYTLPHLIRPKDAITRRTQFFTWFLGVDVIELRRSHVKSVKSKYDLESDTSTIRRLSNTI